MTINESWGYNTTDTRFKSARQLIHSLCEIAGKGGNFLLNVSPMGDGNLQPELAERLAVIEAWMQRNAREHHRHDARLRAVAVLRAIDAARRHLLRASADAPLRAVHRARRPHPPRASVRALASGSELKFSSRCSIIDRLFNPDPLGELTISVPESELDDYATVLAIEFGRTPVR